MNRRLLASTAAVLALGGFMTACGDDKMSKDEMVDKLVDEAGLSEDQATCLIDTLGDDAQDRINEATEDLNSEEMQEVTNAMGTCMGVPTNLTIPAFSIPDFTTPEITAP